MTMLVGCTQKTTVMADRAGNQFNLPKKVNTIISTAPSNTEILVALGLADKLVAIDKYSADVDGVRKDLPEIDFRNPDAETLVGLKPDIIIASGHNKTGNEDPFAAVKEAGIDVVYIPTSSSIEGIYEDINFIAKVTGTERGMNLPNLSRKRTLAQNNKTSRSSHSRGDVHAIASARHRPD